MEIGKYNVLKVARRTDNGLYLVDEAGEEVLLPNKFVTDKMVEGTLGKVFVYKDSQDRNVATTQTPLATINEAAYMEVKQVTRVGTFLDWGLDKELLLPFSEQKTRPSVGDKALVYVYLDAATQRIVASTNMNKFIKNREVTLKPNEEVDLLICYPNETGIRVIVNQKYWGILFTNEVFGKVEQGMHVKGFVKKVRDDGKIDVALQKQGIAAAKDITQALLEKLKANKGILKLSDNSTPEEIHAALGISKKNFKKAVGMLFKDKKIELGDDFIKLLK
jgi:predicted RNA-binding protein (virulence factor B family)